MKNIRITAPYKGKVGSPEKGLLLKEQTQN